MSEHEPAPNLPPANVLWGRVATAVVVVLLAFGLGRCTADGVPEDEVAQLEARATELESTNTQLQAEVDRLNQELDAAPTAPATTEPTEPATDDTSSPSPDAGGEAATEIYRVQPGDTLYGIAITLFGDRDRAQDIAELNGIDNQTTLQVGQELTVPTS